MWDISNAKIEKLKWCEISGTAKKEKILDVSYLELIKERKLTNCLSLTEKTQKIQGFVKYVKLLRRIQWDP